MIPSLPMPWFYFDAANWPYVPRLTDLARMCFSKGEYPQALAILQRAHYAEPWNSSVADGLALARAQVVIPADPSLAAMLQPETLWYPGWLLHPLVMLIAYVAFFVVSVAMAHWFLTRSRRSSNVALIFAIPVLVALCGAIVRQDRYMRDNVNPPIVMYNDAALHIGNGGDYPVIIQLPKGTEGRAIDKRKDWYQIRLASGVQGWVQIAP